jgi:nucleotide-binding universal stress UspA family protein
MTYRRTHLHLCTFGAPTSIATVDYACALSKVFGAALRVTSPRVRVEAPSHWLAGRMIAGVAKNLEDTAAAKAAELDARAAERAAALGLELQVIEVPVLWPRNTDDVTIHGRTSDLCVLDLPSDDVEQRLNVEAWVFETGRPCLLHPTNRAEPFSLESVVIAWDASRTAARAVGDALPLLTRATAVHVLVARGEKTIRTKDPAAALVGYLAAHAVTAVVDEFDVQRRSIGPALLDRAREHGASLLVMGAFGHSRLKEFILGGATREVLDAAPLPILMSH